MQLIELELVAEQTKPHSRSSTIDLAIDNGAVGLLIEALPPYWPANIDFVITVSPL